MSGLEGTKQNVQLHRHGRLVVAEAQQLTTAPALELCNASGESWRIVTCKRCQERDAHEATSFAKRQDAEHQHPEEQEQAFTRETQRPPIPVSVFRAQTGGPAALRRELS